MGLAVSLHFPSHKRDMPANPLRAIIPVGAELDRNRSPAVLEQHRGLGQPIVSREMAGGAPSAPLRGQVQPDGYTLLATATTRSPPLYKSFLMPSGLRADRAIGH